MASLYDKLTQGTAQPQQSQQTAIEKVLQAKKGRVGPAPSGQVSLAEQAIQDDTAAALRQGAAQGGIQQAQQQADIQGQQQALAQQDAIRQQQFQAAQEGVQSQAAMQQRGVSAQEQMAQRGLDTNKARKINQINASASKALQQMAADSQLQTDDIFANFRRDNKDLEFRKDAAQLEQLGHILAMQDQSYMDELQRIGDKRRLYDKSEWTKEKQRLIYGENLNNLMNELNFQRGEDAKGRNFSEQLARMGAADALKIAMASIQDANNAAIFSGGIQAVKAGADYMQTKPKEGAKP